MDIGDCRVAFVTEKIPEFKKAKSPTETRTEEVILETLDSDLTLVTTSSSASVTLSTFSVTFS